ncbi:MAG: ABC transporter substrate-binding protein [Acetobacteraceae bacterium]|nr:ABC transporter substrate-binding protein [Acetobacteraceae bacterium]MDW8399745.1 ABC transporter substrate-binding protein [Acetobacteraceae bacterium]
MKKTLAALAVGAALAAPLAPAPADAQHLRIALREDPDILDPTLARTYVGRIVFTAICDKLFDINERLEIVPQLATGHRWEDPRTLIVTLRDGVRFHDGERMDAAAVVHSLNRHLNLQGSFRRGEISIITAIEAVDPLTVRIRLSAPSAAFLSQLTDRAGMILSPRAADAAGRDFGLRPVCAGPFRFVERVAQSRIVVERFNDYWNRDAIHLERVTFLPIPDNNARIANLQSGAVEFGERMEPDHVEMVARNPRLRVVQVDELGYQGIQYNVNNGPRAQTPFGQNPRVREAFELAIDRAAINQVVYGGAYVPTAQAVPPANPFHIREFTPEPRNVARARQLLQQAGVQLPVRVELTVPNNQDLRQVGEVIQAMVREAGFDLRINAMEFASALQASQRGDFETFLLGWSGRVDPDGNIWAFVHSQGGQNDGRYSNPEVDRLLDAARTELDPERRRALYAQVWQISLRQDRHRMYLWHRRNIFIHSTRLSGYVPVPDGMIRFQGMRLN